MVAAYRMNLYEAANLLAGIPPIELLIKKKSLHVLEKKKRLRLKFARNKRRKYQPKLGKKQLVNEWTCFRRVAKAFGRES